MTSFLKNDLHLEGTKKVKNYNILQFRFIAYKNHCSECLISNVCKMRKNYNTSCRFPPPPPSTLASIEMNPTTMLECGKSHLKRATKCVCRACVSSKKLITIRSKWVSRICGAACSSPPFRCACQNKKSHRYEWQMSTYEPLFSITCAPFPLISLNLCSLPVSLSLSLHSHSVRWQCGSDNRIHKRKYVPQKSRVVKKNVLHYAPQQLTSVFSPFFPPQFSPHIWGWAKRSVH